MRPSERYLYLRELRKLLGLQIAGFTSKRDLYIFNPVPSTWIGYLRVGKILYNTVTFYRVQNAYRYVLGLPGGM